MNSLFGAMTVLRAMCTPQPAFLDRFMPEMLKTLQKLVREHTTPIQPDTIKSTSVFKLIVYPFLVFFYL